MLLHTFSLLVSLLVFLLFSCRIIYLLYDFQLLPPPSVVVNFPRYREIFVKIAGKGNSVQYN